MSFRYQQSSSALPEDRASLQIFLAQVQKRLQAFAARGLHLDMTRGKPSPEQLALAAPLLERSSAIGFRTVDGTDCRNYGGLPGIPEMRAIFANILGVPTDHVVAAGNSSLELMHGLVTAAMLNGVGSGMPAWSRCGEIRFLCPAPGYDRHFRICQEFGIDMVPVPMTDNGPDMDVVERLVADDESIKGMWCVPKYSNPTGAVYAPSVVQRLAAMHTAAADFRLFWDNAYALHHLTDEMVEIENILECCAASGHPNRPFVFTSTSKITLPGAGVAAFASSSDNLRWWMERYGVRTIGPDKLNQLRHADFLESAGHLHALMESHRRILAPKFAAVQAVFDHELAPYGIARWTRPRGGYFITLDLLSGGAQRTVDIAAEAGIVLTPAGATHPYGRDPDDRIIRIAPSYPTNEEVAQAAEGVALCVLVAVVERRLLSPEMTA